MVKTTESIPEDTAKVGVGVGVRSGVVGIMLLDTWNDCDSLLLTILVYSTVGVCIVRDRDAELRRLLVSTGDTLIIMSTVLDASCTENVVVGELLAPIVFDCDCTVNVDESTATGREVTATGCELIVSLVELDNVVDVVGILITTSKEVIVTGCELTASSIDVTRVC